MSGLRQNRNPEQKAADRITPRVLKAVGGSTTDWVVHGGWTGFFETTHDPEVYVAVAGQLREEGVDIEVHRYDEERLTSLPGAGIMSPGGNMSLAAMQFRKTTVLLDRIAILSVNGEPIEREELPQDHAGHVARLYPPES